MPKAKVDPDKLVNVRLIQRRMDSATPPECDPSQTTDPMNDAKMKILFGHYWDNKDKEITPYGAFKEPKYSSGIKTRPAISVLNQNSQMEQVMTQMCSKSVQNYAQSVAR